MSDARQANLRGVLFAILGFAAFSTHDAVIKFLGGGYAAFQILFFSVLLSFPFATLLLLRDREVGTLRPRNPGWVVLRTAAAVATGASAIFAFTVLPIAQVYAFIFAAPFLITIMSIPVLGERVGVHRWAAVLLGLAGVLIVLRPGIEPLTAGHVAALTAAAGSALVSVITRKVGREERAAVLMLYPMTTNVVLMGAILPFVYRPVPVEHMGLFALVAILGYGGGLCIIAAYKHGDAATVAPIQYSQIIWGAGLGLLFFAEVPDLMTGLGAAVIIASGVYVVIRESIGGRSKNTPVLRTRTRPGAATSPNIGAMLRARIERVAPGHEALAKSREAE